MLRSIEDMEGFTLRATDGIVGCVKDFYFDDQNWVVRYAIVETGSWFSSRKVLVSLIAMGQPDWLKGVLPVSITKQQLRNSSDIDTDKPVSRLYEAEFSGYYGYQYYWNGPGYWGGDMYPNLMTLQDYRLTLNERSKQRACGD